MTKQLKTDEPYCDISHNSETNQVNIKYKAVCDSCDGTGLYQGLAEKDGIAVVCFDCKGHGWELIERTWRIPQAERKIRENVTKVIRYNPGICLDDKITKGGIKYEDWLKQKDPSEVILGTEPREFYCPYWYYRSDLERNINWEKCDNGCEGTTRYTECKFFGNKEACWKQFDKEQAIKNN